MSVAASGGERPAPDVASPSRRDSAATLRRALLVCGILSSVLYVGTDLLAAVRFGAYHDFASQTISELGARGAPSKPFVDPPFVFYDLLLIAFGVGVWTSSRGKRGLRAIAGLLTTIAVIGLPEPWLYPMNLRGTGNVRADLPHIVAFGVIVLLIFAAVTIGAFALGRRFRLYSFATILTMLVTGVATGMAATGIPTGEPTPWIGLTERADVGAYLLWVAVLAVSLLRAHASEDAAIFGAPAPLDPFIPHPDVRERFSTTIRAPAEVVMDVAANFDLQSIGLVRAIFWLRQKIMRTPESSPRKAVGLMAEMKVLGWTVLADGPGRLIVCGAVCQPWLGDVRFSPVSPERFATYAEPDHVKIAWTIEAASLGPTTTRLSHETRVVAADDQARAKFRRYWRWAGFGIVGIRLLLMPALRRASERRGPAGSRSAPA